MKATSPSALCLPASPGLPLVPGLLVAGVLFFAGCASTTEVKIDALSKPKAEDAISYSIHNRNPLVEDDSLRYKEAVNMVKTALSGRGLYEAPEEQKADIIVDLDYGVGPPQMKRETYSEPVYLARPGAMHMEHVQVGTDTNGKPITRTVTVQDPPTLEMAGYRERVVILTTYEKYLRLSASDNKPAAEGRPPAQIWTLDAISEGESHDIRKNLPMIVAASIDYIGKDTHGEKTVRIKDSNPDVAFIKKGL